MSEGSTKIMCQKKTRSSLTNLRSLLLYITNSNGKLMLVALQVAARMDSLIKFIMYSLTEHAPELKYFPVHDIYRCVESIKLVVMDVHRKHCFHPGTSPNEKSRAARSNCNFDSIDHQHKGKEQPFFFWRER